MTRKNKTTKTLFQVGREKHFVENEDVRPCLIFPFDEQVFNAVTEKRRI